MSRDTIFALSSGAGRAAVAVIRISGPRARGVAEAFGGDLPAPRRAALKTLRSPATGEALDRALLLWLPAPGSFTGEDSVEFHIHGGRAVTAGVLEAVGKMAGCRLAEPGEFTRRAFVNERIDLTAVEALADLIDAETKAQRNQALRQLGGPLGTQAEIWRAAVVRASALVEAEIDFSDAADVAEISVAAVKAILRPVRDGIADVLEREGRRGERLRDGFTVVIAGPPNAGKSTLLNALACREVAIVSPYAGTTRDPLEIHLDLDGLPVILIDTAGIRESTDPVEREGVSRARQRASHADLVLWLEAVGEAADVTAVPDLKSPVWNVATKVDLATGRGAMAGLAISATTGAGIADLVDRIAGYATECLGGAEDGLITRARHRETLSRANLELERICTATPDLMLELLAEHIRVAARELGRISGRIGTEDILDEIFSRFCIGK